MHRSSICELFAREMHNRGSAHSAIARDSCALAKHCTDSNRRPAFVATQSANKNVTDLIEMALRLDDRYLWLGYGIFAVVAACGIRIAIHDIVRLTIIDASQYPSNDDLIKPTTASNQIEDGISRSTLTTLAASPDPSIATTAQSLIVTRFARLPNATKMLATDLASPSEIVRIKAKQAIRFLRSWSEVTDELYGVSGFDLDGLPGGESSDEDDEMAAMSTADDAEIANADADDVHAVMEWSRQFAQREVG